jgi:hypothetical protein
MAVLLLERERCGKNNLPQPDAPAKAANILNDAKRAGTGVLLICKSVAKL